MSLEPSSTPLQLPPVEAIDAVRPLELPAVLAQLLALQARIVARMATAATGGDEGPDRLLTVKQAAPILGMSEDWLYRNADRLPFTRRTGRRTLRFSERGLTRYLADRGLDSASMST